MGKYRILDQTLWGLKGYSKTICKTPFVQTIQVSLNISIVLIKTKVISTDDSVIGLQQNTTMSYTVNHIICKHYTQKWTKDTSLGYSIFYHIPV